MTAFGLMSLVRCVELKLPPHVPGSCADQEEEDDNTGAIAPGLAPKMSAAKAAKSAAEKDARIAVSLERFFCVAVMFWQVATPSKFTPSFTMSSPIEQY